MAGSGKPRAGGRRFFLWWMLALYSQRRIANELDLSRATVNENASRTRPKAIKTYKEQGSTVGAVGTVPIKL